MSRRLRGLVAGVGLSLLGICSVQAPVQALSCAPQPSVREYLAGSHPDDLAFLGVVTGVTERSTEEQLVTFDVIRVAEGSASSEISLPYTLAMWGSTVDVGGQYFVVAYKNEVDRYEFNPCSLVEEVDTPGEFKLIERYSEQVGPGLFPPLEPSEESPLSDLTELFVRFLSQAMHM